MSKKDVEVLDINDVLDVPEDYYILSEPKSKITLALRDELQRRKLSVRKLADEIGLYHAQIVRVTGSKNYHMDTLLRILYGLDLELVVKRKNDVIEDEVSSTRLDEIKERFEATTYGYWKVYKGAEGTMIGTAHDHVQLKAPAPVVTMATNIKEPHKIVHINEKDADFIAQSKRDMEWLIKEVERLRSNQ